MKNRICGFSAVSGANVAEFFDLDVQNAKGKAVFAEKDPGKKRKLWIASKATKISFENYVRYFWKNLRSFWKT